MMHDYIANIYTFNTRHFTVTVDALAEYETLHDHFMDDEDARRTSEAIDRGELVCFCARATVIGPNGEELATDYLGCCIYEDFDAFMDHRGLGYYATKRRYLAAVARHDWPTADNLRRALVLIKRQGFCYGSYFSDMVRQVCREARKEWNSRENATLRTAV